MFFDNYKHFDILINKIFTQAEVKKIRRHLVGTYECLVKGTNLVRVINITKTEADNFIALGATLYFDVSEFHEDETPEVEYKKFNEEHKYQMDYMQSIKHRVLQGLRNDAINDGKIGEFLGLYGNVDDKYLMDIYVADRNSAKIIIAAILNINPNNINL